jgi:hypothetical protein
VGEGGLWGWIRGGTGKLRAGGSVNGFKREIEREKKRKRERASIDCRRSRQLGCDWVGNIPHG